MRFLSIFLAFALCISLAVPVVAAENDYVLTQQAYDVDGNLHQIYYDPSVNLNYYYINGVMQKGLGLVFVDGYYYYVRTAGGLAADRSYGITTSNGLLPVATYVFDAYGRMVDPPYYPDDWESQWFDSDPTVTVPTDPPATDPPVTVPPATDPPPALDLSVDPSGIMGLLGVAVAACSDWFVSLMDGTGFGGLFLAMVFLLLLYKFLLKPVFGSGGSDKAKKQKEDS